MPYHDLDSVFHEQDVHDPKRRVVKRQKNRIVYSGRSESARGWVSELQIPDSYFIPPRIEGVLVIMLFRAAGHTVSVCNLLFRLTILFIVH